MIENGQLVDAEMLLLKHELHEALSFARLAPWSVDLRSGHVELSDQGLTLLGRSRDDVQSTLEGIFSLFHPDDQSRAMARLAELAASSRSLDDHFRLIHGSGTVVHAWFRGHPVTDETGRVVAIRGIWQDVTARVAIEESLRESEENHRHAVELSAQVLWTAAPDGRILDVGPRWSELTGLPRDEAFGNGWADAIHPDDRDHVVAARDASLASGQPVDCDYRLRLADGSHLWVRARAAARRDEAGRILRWYGSLEDIHDRKVAERRLQSSEAFARSVIESSADPIMVLDHDATIRFVNGPGTASTGYTEKELIGRNWLGLSLPDHRAEAEAAFASARAGDGGSFSAYLPKRDGSPAWWDVAVNPIKRGFGDVRGILVVARDVTEKRLARLEVEAAHLRLSDVLESTADIVLSVDRSWIVTYMNGNAVQLLGNRLKVGDVLFEVYPEYVGTEVHAAYLSAMSGTPSKLVDLDLPNLGIHVDLNLRPTRDGLSMFMRDVTETHEARRAITHLAHHDQLTGLANRVRYTEYLHATRVKGPFALLLLDLDRFKEVNDTLGHAVGDALLREVAGRFAAIVGVAGLIARLGGDEFAAVLPGADVSVGSALARKLVAVLREPLRVEGHDLRTGVTVGVSVEPALATPDAAFKRADLALYHAKSEGGDRFYVYDAELDRRSGALHAMRQDLAMAIERDELSVAYQPMRDVATDRTCAREALMRWTHPTRGSVSPADFIPVAEQSGLVVGMGDWILRKACVDACTWPDEAVVSVNLSPVQFHSGSLPMRVAAALASTGLPPSRLELEITESVLLQDNDDNVALLHALKDLGVRVALDDFGTGFSSLSYLRTFPFDKIKIDRAFVAGIGTGNRSEAIVAAVISLGQALGMTVTAEGVETESQLQWLRDQGCQQVQGYLIGKPGPSPSRGADRSLDQGIR